jgi:hypothetical protein
MGVGSNPFCWPLLASAVGALFLQLDGAAQTSCPTGSKIWLGNRAHYETLLRTGRVVHEDYIPEGVTQPQKLSLKKDELCFAGIWKSIERGRHKGYWESHQAEVAAYEMDKLLGLGMVPPTVMRSIDWEDGSLQWWVEGARLYKELEHDRPPNAIEYSHQLSRMEMFDVLIGNPDRNAGNFMIDACWNVILIDHSRAFLSDEDLPSDKTKLPVQFDRRLVKKLRELDEEMLKDRLGNLLSSWQWEAILARRDGLLSYLDELIAERGEARVLF